LSLFKLKAGQAHGLSKRRVMSALVVLGLLVFSKYFYMASITSYFTFYLIEKFDLSVASSQLPVSVPRRGGGGDVLWRADRRPHRAQGGDLVFDPGRAPFTLLMPYADVLDQRAQRGHRFYWPRRSRRLWCTRRNWCRATWV
jgi:FSR family fosmidomycin resistance protein-like MFS transporter